MPNANGPPVFFSTLTGQTYPDLGQAMFAEHQWQIFFGTYQPSAGIGYEPDDDPVADPTWDPQQIFTQRIQAALSGQRQLTPLEHFIATWAGGYQQVQSSPGVFSIRRGRATQPFVQSRLADFAHARVAVDYDDICRVLDDRTGARRERLAWKILLAANGDQVSFDRYDDYTRRAAAHLLAITQLAEEHATRNPGSAEFARAGLLAVADGVYTFTEVFGRDQGHFTPAHLGGTQQMRDLSAGRGTVDSILGGNMETS